VDPFLRLLPVVLAPAADDLGPVGDEFMEQVCQGEDARLVLDDG